MSDKEKKQQNTFKEKVSKTMRMIFVHNIGYKVLAISTALICWVIITLLN